MYGDTLFFPSRPFLSSALSGLNLGALFLGEQTTHSAHPVSQTPREQLAAAPSASKMTAPPVFASRRPAVPTPDASAAPVARSISRAWFARPD
ncbi:hypothetical protein FRC08_009100 [Ceratobasidium sp. 394]|nr:hypothetical protein FRC08_009100 [Ceratobasidium sp. 394]